MYLNCHSFFSLRYGTLSPEALVKKAAELGIASLVLTDINNTSGVFDFVLACQKLGLKPLVGVEFRNGSDLRYICIAKNAAGFSEINAFLTEINFKKKVFPATAPNFEHVFVIYPMAYLEQKPRLLASEYIGIRHWELSQMYRFAKYNVPSEKWVAWQPVSFLDKRGYNLHRLLSAIGQNTLLSKLHPSTHATERETLLTPELLHQSFAAYPHLILQANALINSCSFSFDFTTSKNKKTFTTNAEDDLDLLKKLAKEGMAYRYPDGNKEAKKRVEKELGIIHTLGFGSYFLITWDIVRYARSRGYFHVGRGSGANSIVAYCIGITDVDPIALDLYFERFINPFRTSPPDFDIDFSWDERDEIIDYVFKRYGKDHVCLLATYNTFQGRSIYRELGKVFGLPKSEIDDLVKNPTADHKNEYTRYIFEYAPMLVDFPNSLSIHAGGILVAEQPLYAFTALQPMPKGFPICLFDMYVAEDIGFAKFDVLSQRGLGHIKTCVDIISENRGINVDVHAIQTFKDDPAIRHQLRNNETMGCFYVESPAMRQLIWKLKCDNYITLVAASSIIRPGVSSSGMMKEYISRHHNPHNINHIHPKLSELMEETYGVMVYQEDVIKVAHHFANLTLAEADVLRRGMSGKYRSRLEFQKIIDKWFANCKELGYTDYVAQEVWRQIESFSGYSFSKAHSASFAVESYQSMYLKTHFPLEFMVAVINNFGGFYATEFYIHEAKRWGAHVEAPEINESHYLTCIRGNVIWLGWIHVKSLEKRTIDTLLNERKGKAYSSFHDLLARLSIGLEQLIVLIRIGAFRNMNIPKKELLWDAHLYLNKKREPDHSPMLFLPVADIHYVLPPLLEDPLEDQYDYMELLGFPIASPFSLVHADLRDGIMCSTLLDHIAKTITIYGYLITWKPVRTKNQKLMGFGYFVDQAGEYFDTTHFPPSLERQPFRGVGVYKLVGRVIEEFGVPSIEIQYMYKLPLKTNPADIGMQFIPEITIPN